MRRHPFDAASFVLGLVVAGAAVVYLVAEVTDRPVDGSWVLPVALIGLGLAAVVAGISRAVRREPDVDPASTDSEDTPSPAP